jgi:hypothetical protein
MGFAALNPSYANSGTRMSFALGVRNPRSW